MSMTTADKIYLPDSRLKQYMIAISAIVIGISYWPLEAFIYSLTLGKGAFLQELLKPDLNELWLRSFITLLFISFGVAVQALLNHQIKLTSRMRDQEAKTRLIIDTANEAFFAMDDFGIIHDWNPYAEKLFGWKRNEILSNKLSKTIIPDEQHEEFNQILSKLNRQKNDTQNTTMELRAKRRDGKTLLIELVVTSIQKGEHTIYNAFARDVTERKNFEEKLKYLSYHDSLTGLPNRQLFYDRLNNVLSLAHRKNYNIALLFLDLDGFKAVNDNYGHDLGDELLKEIARRLSTHTRSMDTVARLGGDEFILLLPDIGNRENAASVAEKIIDSLKRPFDALKGTKIGGSIGISMYPDHGESCDMLVQLADSAMYEAKKAGRNRYFFADRVYSETEFV
jgi:diguanylate cyclase (GGDEF)-like protein/PAS domain S-box-containing protein